LACDATGHRSALSAPITITATIPPEGEDLPGHWESDEGLGSVAEDFSGYGHDGTIIQATWASGNEKEIRDPGGSPAPHGRQCPYLQRYLPTALQAECKYLKGKRLQQGRPLKDLRTISLPACELFCEASRIVIRR